ncbi:flagellar biosynthetic protein FliR [Thermocrinis albus]|nr:flagellar biosynthetic protein FliR [Thermocrinis albus]
MLYHIRVTAFLFLVPFFGKEFLPQTFKVFLSTALSLSIFMYTDPQPLSPEAPLLTYVVKEFLLGFVAGLVLRLVFDAAQTAGEIISYSIGLSYATLFVPQLAQMSLFSLFLSLLTTVTFLQIGGPEVVFLALVKSFQTIPVGSFPLWSLDPQQMVKLFHESFSLGFRVALPLVISTLLVNLGLALINRLIPQVNVFMVGLPLQLMVGYIILFLVFPLITDLVADHVRENIIRFVQMLG